MTHLNRQPSPSRFRAILGYASLALMIFLLFAGFRGYRDLTLAREREARLEQAIARTEDEIVRLGREVERLRGDPVLLERLAREELGMVMPGDVVVLVDSGAHAGRPSSTATARPSVEPSSDRPEPASP